MVRLTKTTDVRQVKRATYEELERLREDLEAVERQGVYTTNFYAHMSKAVLDAVDHEVKQLYVERNEPRSYKKNCWWSWPAHEFFFRNEQPFLVDYSRKIGNAGLFGRV